MHLFSPIEHHSDGLKANLLTVCSEAHRPLHSALGPGGVQLRTAVTPARTIGADKHAFITRNWVIQSQRAFMHDPHVYLLSAIADHSLMSRPSRAFLFECNENHSMMIGKIYYIVYESHFHFLSLITRWCVNYGVLFFCLMLLQLLLLPLGFNGIGSRNAIIDWTVTATHPVAKALVIHCWGRPWSGCNARYSLLEALKFTNAL